MDLDQQLIGKSEQQNLLLGDDMSGTRERGTGKILGRSDLLGPGSYANRQLRLISRAFLRGSPHNPQVPHEVRYMFILHLMPVPSET